MLSKSVMPCAVIAGRAMFLLLLWSALTGCDQLGDRLSTLFPPPTAERALADMASHEANKATAKAIRVGEAYISKSPNPDDSVRKELIKLYLQEGDSSSALRHLRLVKGAIESVESSMKDDQTSPLSPSAAESPQIPSGRKGPEVAVDGASVTAGPSGVEVRAGDAVVRTPR